MVIMRVWTLAHTHTLPHCFHCVTLHPFAEDSAESVSSFYLSGAQGLFSPKKKAKHPKLDHVFLATCSPAIFLRFLFYKKTNASIANVSQRFVGIGPANFTSQVVPTTRCLTKKCTDGNHFSWRWTSPFWGVFGCLGYWSIFSTCEEYV